MTARELAAALSAPDAETRGHGLAALAECLRAEGGPAIDDAIARALLVPLASASRTEQRHTADCVAPVAAAAPALLAVLREALAAPDARLRWGAAYTLGRALPPARELWLSALETMRLDDGDQRWAAAELACRIARNDANVLADLRGALGDPSPTLRKMVLYCLRDLRDPGASDAARALLSDTEAGVRLAALAALAAAGGGAPGDDVRRTADRVAALLGSDPDAGVRRAAAATLGKLGIADPPVDQALRAAACSADASLARAAAGALRALALPG